MGKRFHKKKHRRNKRYQRYTNNAAETAVVWVCERWQEQKKILSYIHSWKNGQTDREGIDFVIFLKSGLAAPVQVTFKKSDEQIEEKRAHHYKIHPHVKMFLIIEKLPQGDVAKDAKVYRKITQDLAEEINKLASSADKIDPDIGEP